MMMNNLSFTSSFWMMHGLNSLAGFLFLIGLVLCIAWAVKNLKKEQILNWGIGLLIAGIIIWLLSGTFGGFGYSKYRNFSGFGYGMMDSSMWKCVQDEECHEEMESWMDEMMDFE